MTWEAVDTNGSIGPTPVSPNPPTFTGETLTYNGTQWAPQPDIKLGSGFVTWGSGGNFANVAGAGNLRFKNTQGSLVARNAGNTADLYLLGGIDASNLGYVGADVSNTATSRVDGLRFVSATDHGFIVGSNTLLTIDANGTLTQTGKSGSNVELTVVSAPIGQTTDIQTWRVKSNDVGAPALGWVVADITATGALETTGISFQQNLRGTNMGGGNGVISETFGGSLQIVAGAQSNGNVVIQMLTSGQLVYQYNGTTKQYWDTNGLYLNNAQTVFFKDTVGIYRDVLRGTAGDVTALAALSANGISMYTTGFGAVIASFTSTYVQANQPIYLPGAPSGVATGNLRAANNTTIIAARNAANSADISVIGTDASNNILIGGSVYAAAMTPVYGSISQNTGSQALATTFAALTGWDASGANSGVTLDTINGTITINTTGIYLIGFSGSPGFSGLNGTGIFRIVKNGLAVAGLSATTQTISTGNTVVVTMGSIPVSITAGDVIKVEAKGSAAGLSVAWFAESEAVLSVARIG